MDRKKLYLLWGAAAAAGLAAAVLVRDSAGLLSGMLSFPFLPLGGLMRRMSLSGAAGNAAAIAVYVLIGLLPAAWLLIRLIKRRARAEDTLLAAMCALLFAGLYGAVNPGLRPRWLGPAAGGGMGVAFLGGVFWSVTAAYLALRALRACLGADAARLAKYGRWTLAALGAAAVLGAFGVSPGGLLAEIASLRAGNTGNEGALGPTYAFLALRYAASAAAYLLDLWAVSAGVTLLDAWDQDRYGEAAVAAANRLASRCAVTLGATAILGVVLQLGQLLMARRLYALSAQLTVPLTPLALLLAALMAARYLREGKQLKDDNDLFI